MSEDSIPTETVGPIGRSSATESDANTSDQFSFWLRPRLLVNPFDIVQAEHFNGTRWALIPAPAAGTAELNRISFMAPSNGSAVGSSGGGSHTQALIEHWNGHHWTIARTPAIPGSTNLADVLALTPHLAGPSAATPHPTAVAAPSSNDGTAGPGPSPPAPNAHPPANCWAPPAPHSTSGRSAPPSPTP